MHERIADLGEKDLKESGFVRGYALIYIRRQISGKISGAARPPVM